MAKNLIPIDLEDSVPDNTVGTLPDIPDDNYLFQVDGLESDIDENDRRWYKVTAFIVNDCAYKGTTFTEKFTFPADGEDDYSKKGRNRFHMWLLCIGIDLKKRKFGIDPESVKGQKFWSRTYHHTMPASDDGKFKERQYSRLGPFSPYDEEIRKRAAASLPATARRNEEDDEEDEDIKPSKASKRAVVDDDEDEDEPPKRRRVAKLEDDDDEEDEKPARRRRPAVAEDDEDEEEEDEKPARKAAAAKPARRGRKPAADEEEDEDEEEAVFPTRPAKGAGKAVAKGRKRAAVEEDEDED